MHLDNLLDEAAQNGISVNEIKMPRKIKGLYGDKTIWINRTLRTRVKKACVLAEELGHHHTTSGNILDQSHIQNRKQERRARQWAFERLIPLRRFIDVYHAKLRSRYEIANFLGVTEEFLQASIDRYRDIYGVCVSLDKRYIIIFEPLSIVEMYEVPETLE